MTNELIFDIISQGEGVTIEFKECKNEIASEVYPTVCSFSNRFGGHILMGVTNEGEIIGVNPNCVSDMKKNFSNNLNNPQKISPTLYLSIEEIILDGKIILYVYVPRSSQVHTCNKLTYDRIGDADINISSNTTLMSELYIRKQTDFTEKKIFPYLTIDDLDMTLMSRVRNLAKSKDANHPWILLDDMGIFRSAGLYDKDFTTGQEGFNLAAVLLFGKDETIHSCLPAYKTDAIYREVNIERYDDRDEVRTNLIDSYERLTDFICRHIDDKFYLEGTQRVSIRSIIVREIVSNILMHREYSSSYPAKIIVEKDRIVTENANKAYHYGRIVDASSPYPKNPLIARFFNNIGRADELGSGIRNLYKYTKIYSGKEPILFEDIIFKVEIPLASVPTANKMFIADDKTPITDDKTPITDDKTSITDDKASITDDKASITDDKASITEDKAAITEDKAAITEDKAAITEDKAAITEDKAAITEDKAAITEDKAAITGDKAATIDDKMPINSRQEKILNYIYENQTISTMEVCKILNLKQTRAKEILRKMVDDGLIIAIGEKRNRKYKINNIP